MQVLSLFSGIGAYEKALERLGVNVDVVNYCEIDKFASKAYSLIHGVSEEKNLHDVRLVDGNNYKDIDLITYSFPCTDISPAGNKKGFVESDGSLTRSGLFFEGLRIIKDAKPKFAICENVKMLTTKRFAKEFDVVLKSLDTVGYNNYWQVINSKEFGIPQNRERVFVVSIRKDIDEGFEFPVGQKLTKCLRDILEDEVDERFYLTEQAVKCMVTHKERHKAKGNGFGAQVKTPDEISPVIQARYYKDGSDCLITESKVIQVGNVHTDWSKWSNPQCGRVYDPKGLCPALTVMQGGDRQPKVILKKEGDANE